MSEEKYIIDIPEKGDIKQIEHFLKCAEQAEQRARQPWLKQACAYRCKMLIRQLASMKERSNT